MAVATGTAIKYLKDKMGVYNHYMSHFEPVKTKGKVNKLVGLVMESTGPEVSIGDLCCIERKNNPDPLIAEVVGLRDEKVLLMPLGVFSGVTCGDLVNSSGSGFEVPVGEAMLGRIIDGLGRPMDEKGDIQFFTKYPVNSLPPSPLSRNRILEPIGTGIKAIDGLLTMGKGQRMGIFAGSGVGKSMLMGMIARYSEADINVIGLIGERGRELNDFLENSLGEEGLRKSVVVVATSDQPALIRIKGALVAHSIAEYFRDQGYNVMLMMDSLTRFAMAQREVGLSVGEPPTSKGYTPSVFSMLPSLLERSGPGEKGCGSITGLYTVLVEGDDFNEPIADAVRAILDGHIVLSRDIAATNHYPAIDILNSVSRLMNEIVPKDHTKCAGKLREVIATYKKAEDLINIGAYVKGSNPKIDFAIKMIDSVNNYLKQNYNESSIFDENYKKLINLFKDTA